MSKIATSQKKKFTIRSFESSKRRGVPVSVMTAYDYTSALLVERAGIDCLLVGDSLGMVMLGRTSTNTVTMEEMLHHCKAVARGAQRPFLVGDMPFMSYQADVAEAVRNAGRFLQEGGMEAVKVEGGAEIAPTVRAIVAAGIPVMGHIGLTPQRLSQLGGYRMQGRTAPEAQRLVEDALALQAAGCFSIVLESIPAKVGEVITEMLDITTIGIGAGARTDAQVLVFHDALGLFDDFVPRFVRRYASLGETAAAALAEYHTTVKEREFPAEEHTYAMDDGEQKAFEAWLATRSGAA